MRMELRLLIVVSWGLSPDLLVGLRVQFLLQIKPGQTDPVISYEMKVHLARVPSLCKEWGQLILFKTCLLYIFIGVIQLPSSGRIILLVGFNVKANPC